MTDRIYRHLNVECSGDVAVARLTHREFDDAKLNELGAELARPVDEDGYRNLILVLGPQEPDCLYSVFLAKLLILHRRLEKLGGKLMLAEVPPLALNVIRTTGLERFLNIHPTCEDAQASLSPGA